MQWQLYVEVDPTADRDHRDVEAVESLLAELAPLELSAPWMSHIRLALTHHFSTQGRPVVHVLISQPLRSQTLPDWKFFVVTRGDSQANDQGTSYLELYLYR